MDFKQLETFVAIAKYKSFSNAAKHLYLTQPTISNHISALEKELKTTLINRTTKKISLTKAGKILYKYSIDILNIKDRIIFSLGEFNGTIEGQLEIAASTIPEQFFLPNLLGNFNKSYPDVKYILMKYDTKEVIEKIIRNEIDFGFVGAKLDSNNLEYVEIMEDDIILVGPNNKKFENIDEITFDELIQQPIIIREEGSGTRKAFEDILCNNNLEINDLNIFATIENTEAIKECVRKELGLTLISQKAVKCDIALGKLKKIDIKDISIQRKFYFVYGKNTVLSPLREAFKDYVIDCKKLQNQNIYKSK